MRNKQIVLFLIAVILLLSGCSVQSEKEIDDMQVSVEWVDAIVWDGKKYYYDEEKTAEINKNDIEKELGKITFTVIGSDEDDNPEYQLKNGEATFVGEGATVYYIKGEDIAQFIYAQDKAYSVVK